jgi:heptosyltransferase-2/heptosyltransferase-3
MQPSVNSPPLVVRCGAFGDMVLVTPLLRALAVRFGCRVDVLTSGPWSVPLLDGQPGVGEILCVRSRKAPYWLSPGQRRAVRWLRTGGVRPIWYCDGNDAARQMLARAGVSEDWIVDVKDHPLLPGEHATQQWRRLARVLPRALTARGGPPAVGDSNRPVGLDALYGADGHAGPGAGGASEGGCRLEVSEVDRAQLVSWLDARGLSARPLIAIQAGNKRTMRRGLRRLAVNTKYWPVDHWAAVIRHLRARLPRHTVVLLGARPEYSLNQEIIAAAAVAGLHNAADDLPVTRLVAMLERSSGLISVDSGPAHAAAAVGCPLVVLFGKASTTLYRPWGEAGADVRVLTGVSDGSPSMLGIRPAEVISAWDALRLRAACPA